MSSILFDQPKNNGPSPINIAMYSIVPGIGQFYNGKNVKGSLFLTATFLSLLVIYSSLNPSVTLEFGLLLISIWNFVFGFVFKLDYLPSPAAESLMNYIRFGGTFSVCMIILILFFISYSMVDAYIDADIERKKATHKIFATELSAFRFSESTTASYIIHIAFISMLFLLSLFLVFPKQEIEQVTEIEFIMPQVESKKPPPPKTKRKSTVQSVDQGKHNPKKPVTPPQKSRPVSVPKPQPKAAKPQKVAKPAPAKPVAKPIPKKPAPVAAPKVVARPALNPIKPVPVPIKSSSNTSKTANSKSAAPAPDTRGVSGGMGSSTSVSAVPRIPGFGGKGGIGNAGNPPPNSNPNAPSSIAAQKDLDFGPYMEALQRRIKRNWTPPRGNQSKRVVVTFRINTVGQISNLRIKKGAGNPISNNAALVAVKKAAPFPKLPNGAPPEVDIEFTFDYNVFGSDRY